MFVDFFSLGKNQSHIKWLINTSLCQVTNAWILGFPYSPASHNHLNNKHGDFRIEPITRLVTVSKTGKPGFLSKSHAWDPHGAHWWLTKCRFWISLPFCVFLCNTYMNISLECYIFYIITWIILSSYKMGFFTLQSQPYEILGLKY